MCRQGLATRCSGKSELVVAARLACNRYLATAVQRWAFYSLIEFYDAHVGRGKTTTSPTATALARAKTKAA